MDTEPPAISLQFRVAVLAGPLCPRERETAYQPRHALSLGEVGPVVVDYLRSRLG
jgi:hypothetical protein